VGGVLAGFLRYTKSLMRKVHICVKYEYLFSSFLRFENVLLSQFRFRRTRPQLHFTIASFQYIEDTILVHTGASLFHDGYTFGTVIKVHEPTTGESNASKARFGLAESSGTSGNAAIATGEDGNVFLATVIITGNQPIDVGIGIVADLGPN